MTNYPYDMDIVVDPNNPDNVVRDMLVSLYAPDDATNSTLLDITDPNGVPLPNPLPSNGNGYLPARIATTSQMKWVSGEYSGFFNSYRGLRDEAVNARTAAESAESSAASAAALVGAPADAAVATLIGGPTESRTALDLRFAPDQGGKPVGKGELVVNVRDKGATGNGVADDYAAVAAAVTQLQAAGGGTLLFPPGTYNLLSRVRLRSNIKVIGYGATLIKTSVASGYAVFFTASDGAQGYGSGDSNIIIEGLEFRGDFATNGGICAGAFHHSDNITVRNCKFTQCAGKGHVFDLNGCSNITIRDSAFLGFLNAGGGWAKEEAIQIDISNADSASAPDLPGSWDGLPTKNVLVDNNKFLPLTVGGTTYPAPNPLGSHSTREGAVHSNIKFTNNYVLDPLVDATSDVRGILHFIGTHTLRITDNTFEFSSPSTAVVLGLYGTDQGQASTVSNEAGASAPVTTIAPLTIRDVVFRGNTLKNFGATSGQALITITPAGGSGTIYTEDVTLDDNRMEITGAGSSATNFIYATYVKSLAIIKNKFKGQGRPVYCLNVVDLKVLSNRSESPRTDAFRADSSSQVKMGMNTVTGAPVSSFYLTLSTDVKVFQNDVLATGASGTRAVAINGCTRFGVISNDIEAPAGTKCIEVYGTSASGYVRSNVLFGGTTTHVVFAGTGVTEDLNIKL